MCSASASLKSSSDRSINAVGSAPSSLKASGGFGFDGMSRLGGTIALVYMAYETMPERGWIGPFSSIPQFPKPFGGTTSAQLAFIRSRMCARCRTMSKFHPNQTPNTVTTTNSVRSEKRNQRRLGVNGTRLRGAAFRDGHGQSHMLNNMPSHHTVIKNRMAST